MPRPRREMPGGYVYHAMNRGFLRCGIFSDAHDYDLFLSILASTKRKFGMRICAFCLMPNHWHLALWPEDNNITSKFMQRLTSIHVGKWRRRWGSAGHLYQGRFRSFPVETTDYYYTLIRYIEQNPVRAGLVKHPWEWKWSSAWFRENPEQANFTIDAGPAPLPSNWRDELSCVHSPQNLKALRSSLIRCRPLGSDDWVQATAEQFGLLSTLNVRGRPKKNVEPKTVKGA